MSEETTVYVVDSDAEATESIAAAARSKGIAVRASDSSDATLAELCTAKGACVVLQVAAGQEIQTRLQQVNQSVPVVVTGPADVRVAVRAMQQGAVTYLAIPLDPNEVNEALDLAFERIRKHDKHDLRARFMQLTASEREVLSRVIDGQPNRRIAADLDMGLRTVELRRSNIMRKIGASNLSELIRLSIEANFPNGLPPSGANSEKSNGEADLKTTA